MKKFSRKFMLPVLAFLMRWLLWGFGVIIPQQEKDEIRQLLERRAVAIMGKYSPA